MTRHVATNHSSSPQVTSQPTTLLHLTSQATSWHQNRSHHHHGTAESSFTAKKRFGHRVGRSPCAHSIGKFFLCYLVVALTHATYPKLAPLLRARRKTESHAIAKTHTTNSKSHCARLIQHIHWHHQTLTKPCAHGVKHKDSSFQLSHQRQQITLCTAHLTHQPLTSPNLNQTMRTLCRTPRKFIPILAPTTANHTVHSSFSTPATDITNLNKTMRTRCKTTKTVHSNSHTNDSKSHCARLIQHTSHWHHQTLTKPCAHGVKHKENSFQLSHQRQQIILCTAHSAHQPLTSPSLNQTMRTLCGTPKKSHSNSHTNDSKWHCAQQITLCTAHSSQHRKCKRRRNQNEMLNEIGTRWERDPGSASGNLSLFLPQPQIIGKNTFHDFPKISRTRICFLLTLSLPLFYSSLLCLSSVHIVGFLTPKLPLNIYTFQSLPRSDWQQHLQPSPNTAGTQTVCTSYNIQNITKPTNTWQNPAGTQNGTSFGRSARVRASTLYIVHFSSETSAPGSPRNYL